MSLIQNRMDKPSSLLFSDHGATMQLLHSRSVSWLRPMSKLITFFRSCEHANMTFEFIADMIYSAELEMTVIMLIQIDKLVQLLESPVFTC